MCSISALIYSLIVVIILLLRNFIGGREFLSLTAEEVKVMVPPIGLAKKIIRLISSSKVCIENNMHEVLNYFCTLCALFSVALFISLTFKASVN